MTSAALCLWPQMKLVTISFRLWVCYLFRVKLIRTIIIKLLWILVELFFKRACASAERYVLATRIIASSPCTNPPLLKKLRKLAKPSCPAPRPWNPRLILCTLRGQYLTRLSFNLTSLFQHSLTTFPNLCFICKWNTCFLNPYALFLARWHRPLCQDYSLRFHMKIKCWNSIIISV